MKKFFSAVLFTLAAVSFMTACTDNNDDYDDKSSRMKRNDKTSVNTDDDSDDQVTAATKAEMTMAAVTTAANTTIKYTPAEIKPFEIIENTTETPTEYKKPEPIFKSVSSSSELAPEHFSNADYTYYASNAYDGNMNTCWCEDVNGTGIGESITFYADSVQYLNSMEIYGGVRSSSEIYYKNSRPIKVRIELDDGSSYDCSIADDYYNGTIYDFGEEKSVSRVTVTILETIDGSTYDDTCISEIYFK